MIKTITEIINELINIRGNHGEIETDDSLDLYNKSVWVTDIECENTKITDLIEALIKIRDELGELETDHHQHDLNFYNGDDYIICLDLEEVEDK